jgi:hypothetical protein
VAKKPNIKDYIYCEDHDIFFNKKLKEEADKKREECKGESYLRPFIIECPMCTQDAIMGVMSFGRTRTSQRERLMSGRRFTGRKSRGKDLIQIKRTKG